VQGVGESSLTGHGVTPQLHKLTAPDGSGALYGIKSAVYTFVRLPRSARLPRLPNERVPHTPAAAGPDELAGQLHRLRPSGGPRETLAMGAVSDVRRLCPGVVADLRAQVCYLHLDEWDMYGGSVEFLPEREIERGIRHLWGRLFGCTRELLEIIVVEERYRARSSDGK